MFKVALPCALLLLASPASAVLLGSVQGQVLIGRPLDVLVHSRLEPGQDLADLCLQTDVVFGETVQPSGQLAVTVHALGADGALLLRLRSSQPVNEPVVSLHLQAGCQAVFRRSYTLLADWEPAALVGAAAVAAVTPSATAADPALAAQALPVLDAQTLLQSPVRLHPPRARPERVGAVRSKAAARPPVSAPAATGTVASVPALPPVLAATGARLQLDPVAPAAATALSAAPPSPVLPDAAPALSSPLDAGVEPVPLAPELEALRSENERLRLALESAIAQLPPKPEAESAPVAGVWPWISASAAVVLLLLSGLWYLLRSGRLLWVSSPNPAPAWLSTLALRSPREQEQPDDTAFGKTETRVSDMRVGNWPGAPNMVYLPVQAEQAAPARTDAIVPTPAPVDPHHAAVAADSTASAPARSPAAAAATAAPAAARVAEQADPGAGAARAVAPASAPFWEGYDLAHGLEVADGRASMFAEVPIAALNPALLLEAWQQADFFESIAQPQQAMQVLAAFIQEHPRASEAPYLRWLWLEAQAGGVADAGLAARCYENHFQRMAPALAVFAGTEGLENDSAWMGKLQAQWPLLPARELLQQALASQPGEEALPGAFKLRSLAAFDDLILLLALLDTLDQTSVEAPVLAALTLPPLAAAPPVAAAPAAQGTERDPMWIDFDLSHLDAVSAQPAPSGAAVPAKPNQSALPPAVG